MQILLEDAFGFFGRPPCSYDIRGMGSIGREEITLYPCLEFFILVDSLEHQDYFSKLLKFLQLQIISLGETPGNIVFTCLGFTNKCGLRLENGGTPLDEHGLIGTAKNISANLPLNSSILEGSILPLVVLRSTSLVENPNIRLFQDFQFATDNALNLNNVRTSITLMLLQRKLKNFKRIWTSPTLPVCVQVEDHYNQFLDFLLSEMTLCWDIHEVNSLDIIDSLVVKQVLMPESGNFLRATLSPHFIAYE